MFTVESPGLKKVKGYGGLEFERSRKSLEFFLDASGHRTDHTARTLFRGVAGEKGVLVLVRTMAVT